jgi:hypothetical protein
MRILITNSIIITNVIYHNFRKGHKCNYGFMTYIDLLEYHQIFFVIGANKMNMIFFEKIIKLNQERRNFNQISK